MLMLLVMLTFWHLTWTKSSQLPVVVITNPKTPPAPPAIINNQNTNQNSAGIVALNWLQSPETKAAISYAYSAFLRWLYTNRISIACCTLICLTLYFYHEHTKANDLFYRSSWSHWCLEHDPQTITTDHLLIAIHQHHLNTTTISNSSLLFADFLYALEEEKKKLQKAQWIESFFKKIYLHKLFKSAYDIDQLTNDLSTLRTRFIDWYAHQVIIKGLYDI